MAAPVGEFAADVGASGMVKACHAAGEARVGPEEVRASGRPELGPVLREIADKLAGGRPLRAACVAVAGRVTDGACRLTHVDWPDVSEARLGERLGTRVRLVNDLAAHARFVAGLYDAGRPAGGVEPIRPGAGRARRVVAVGMGAGLGVGRAFREGDGPFAVLDSEGGHRRFAPEPGIQDDLLAHLRGQVGGFVSYEHVLSGMGLPRVYAFLRDRSPGTESDRVRDELAKEGADPGDVIGKNAAAGDALCRATFTLVAEIAAQYAADVAVHDNADVIALCGGVAQKNPRWFTRAAIDRAFTRNPLKRDELSRVDVVLVKERYSAVYGALAVARDVE